MRDFLIDLNEKYQRNKFTMWIVVIAVVLFILVTRGMDKMAKSMGGSKENATSTSISTYSSKISQNTLDISKIEDSYSKVEEQVGSLIKTKQDKVALFVYLCNNQKVNAAYEMLSDGCKNAVYPTIEDFKKNYHSVIFKTSKGVDITSFKNNTYQVKYTNDKLTTGGKDESSIIDYITVTDDYKVNVSNLVESKKTDVTSIAPYFTVYVEEEDTYIDYVELKIKVKNNTKADIYINDEDNNQLTLIDKNNAEYKVDNDNLFNSTYLVSAGAEKELVIKFYKGYSNQSKLKEICFNNIKIVNKDYLDSTSQVKNPVTGAIEYENRTTKYPTSYSWRVNL